MKRLTESFGIWLNDALDHIEDHPVLERIINGLGSCAQATSFLASEFAIAANLWKFDTIDDLTENFAIPELPDLFQAKQDVCIETIGMSERHGPINLSYEPLEDARGLLGSFHGRCRDGFRLCVGTDFFSDYFVDYMHIGDHRFCRMRERGPILSDPDSLADLIRTRSPESSSDRLVFLYPPGQKRPEQSGIATVKDPKPPPSPKRLL